MDPEDLDSSTDNNSYGSLMTNTTPSSTWLEIRLFYVRISPCSVDSVPDQLTLRHLRCHVSTPVEINGVRIPSSALASVSLRRDRLNKESSEVTYVSTDSVRLMSSVEFEVVSDSNGCNEMLLCGSLERMESAWGTTNDNEWSIECYVASAVNSQGFQLRSGSIEVYIAGCCGGVPVILTKTIMVSPRRRGSRCGVLDSIPEDEEMEKVNHNGLTSDGLVRLHKVQIAEPEEGDDDELCGKLGNGYHSEDMYYGEDGQLSWFNAGVRVGVGIGLGMCIGIGIGVGLLMSSYQATTRNFRRRFL